MCELQLVHEKIVVIRKQVGARKERAVFRWDDEVLELDDVHHL